MPNNHNEALRKADILCLREQYDRAIDIYNQILDEDMECEEAYVGLLKAHSEYFTVFEGEQIDKDIRIIERIFPDIENEEYLAFLKKRKEAKVASRRVDSTKVEKKKDIPASTSSYVEEEIIEEDFDIKVYAAYISDYLLEKDEAYDAEHQAYYYSVMENPSAPMNFRAEAAEVLGYCYHRMELYGMALSCYEFALENIKSYTSCNGSLFHRVGWLYIGGAGPVPMNKEKAKHYWLIGRNEYNNEDCRINLKAKFGI